MSTLKLIGLQLGAVFALLAAPLAAHATLFLQGPTDWVRGETIAIELMNDEATPVNTLFFDAQYVNFESVLQILNNPADTLPADIKATNPCNRDDVGDICAFFAAPAKSLPQGSVAKWEFLVKNDAPLGPVSFDFDLLVEADTGAFGDSKTIGFPEGTQFAVVPETSSWVLMLAGLMAVGARAYRRRFAAA